MLTLVAAVLVYDRAYDAVLDNRDSRSVSRNVRSDTNEEKDMLRGAFDNGGYRDGCGCTGSMEVLGSLGDRRRFVSTRP